MPSDMDLWVSIKGDTSSLQEATRRGSQEMRQFAREAMDASRVIEAIKSPTEQLADKQKRLNDLYEKGHLDAKQYGKAVDQLADEHAKLTKKQEEAADSRKVFSKDNLNKVIGFTAGVGTLTAGVGALAEVFRQSHEEAKQAWTALDSLIDKRNELAQVSDDKKDLARITVASDALAQTVGMERDEAAAMMFSAKSTGFTSEIADVARASKLLGTEAAATVAGKTRGLFAGEGLTANQMMSSVLLGADSSDLNFADLAKATPQASEAASMAGASSAEVIAALSQMALQFKSGDTAADRLKLLMSKFGADDRFKGGGLLGGMRKLGGMSEEERGEFLGSDQGLRAIVSKMEAAMRPVSALAASIKADQQAGGAILKSQLADRASDPLIMQRDELQRQTVRKEIGLDKYAFQEARRQTFWEQQEANSSYNTLARSSTKFDRMVAGAWNAVVPQAVDEDVNEMFQARNQVLQKTSRMFADPNASGKEIAEAIKESNSLLRQIYQQQEQHHHQREPIHVIDHIPT